MRKRKHLVVASLLVIVGAVLLYFVLTAIYELPAAASDEADTIDVMFTVYFGLIAFMFALIMVFMLYAVFAFRRRPGDTEDAAHIHSNTRLEITWTILPVVLVIGLGAWGATTLSDLIKEKPGEMVVKVTGQQWAWSFGYPEYDNAVSAELVLLVNQPVVLEMTSKDVLHSFWVPEFRVKQDLLPGRETTLRITPTDAGEYKLRCAEICGLNHTEMLAAVRVLNQSAFDAWAAEISAAPVYAELSPAERGELWYGVGGFACLGCHSIDGSARPGPTWQGLVGRQESLADGQTIVVDEAYIRNSILAPNDQIVAGFNPDLMPQNYGELFAAREAEILDREGIEIDIIEDLIAYMATLE